MTQSGMQAVNQSEDSGQKDNVLTRLLSVTRTQWRAHLTTQSLSVLYTVSSFLLKASLILSVTVFAFTAFYLTVVPTEVSLYLLKLSG